MAAKSRMHTPSRNTGTYCILDDDNYYKYWVWLWHDLHVSPVVRPQFLKCRGTHEISTDMLMAWKHNSSAGRVMSSYCKISQRLKAARFVFRIVRSLWNLTGTSAAVLPRCLPKLKVMGWFKLPISRLRDFTRIYDKTPYRILKRGPLWGPVQVYVWDPHWKGWHVLTASYNTEILGPLLLSQIWCYHEPFSQCSFSFQLFQITFIIRSRHSEWSTRSPGKPGLWWRHQMEIFSALLALCAGNSLG